MVASTPSAADLDKFILRMPDGLRDRIAASAERNQRSMNAEIVQALLHFFPPEPTVAELFDQIELTLDMASRPNGPPYRKKLFDQLTALRNRIAHGVELDRSPSRVASVASAARREARRDMLLKVEQMELAAKRDGVSPDDLAAAIENGLFDGIGSFAAFQALAHFKHGRDGPGLNSIGMGSTVFTDPAAAKELIVKALEPKVGSLAESLRDEDAIAHVNLLHRTRRAIDLDD